MNKELTFKISASLLSGLAASFWGIYGAVICSVLIVICLDVITGLIKVKATGQPLSSDKGFIGFWKKIALIAALVFGIFLDVFVPILLGAISLELPFTLPIGTICGCYIVINESISIIENINAAAPGALPKWIKKLLVGAGDALDNGKETKTNEDDN